MNKVTLNIAKEILIELDDLKHNTIGLKESLVMMNVTLNAARRLAEAVVEEEAA